MRTNFSKVIAIIAILMSWQACSENESYIIDAKDYEISGFTEDGFIDAEEIDSSTWEKHYERILQELTSSNSEENQMQTEAIRNYLESLRLYKDSMLNVMGINAGEDGGSDSNCWLGYKYTTIRYMSVDENNQPIILSALVVWPYNAILKTLFNFMPDADGIVLGCRATITSNGQRPTNYKNKDLLGDIGMLACAAKCKNINGGWLAAYENLVIIPDCQGYGASVDRAHPYLEQDLTARQMVDAIIAGKKFYEKELDLNFESDWNCIAMGYSQGGATAMAVQRYIEKNNLEKTMRFDGSLCGDGPYNPMATVNRYIKDNKIYMPTALALIFQGMIDANPFIKNKYSASDFFTQKFLDTKIFEAIEKKKFSPTGLQKELFKYSGKYSLNDNKFMMYRHTSIDVTNLTFKTGYYPYVKENLYDSDGDKIRWEEVDGYATPDQILRPEIIQWIKGEEVDKKYTEKLEDLGKALEKNNLANPNAGWTPKRPIVIVHSQNDEIVPIDNYHSVMEAFFNKSVVNGYRYVSGAFSSHRDFGGLFFASYSDPLSRWLFNREFKKSKEHEDKVPTPYF